MVEVLGSKCDYVGRTSQQYSFFARDVVVMFGNGPFTIYNKEWMLLEINELKFTHVIKDRA